MNPYKILGINEQATDEEVKRAYRAMAAKYHPDVGGDAWVFEQVREAYDRICRIRQPTTASVRPSQATRPARAAAAKSTQQSGQKTTSQQPTGQAAGPAAAQRAQPVSQTAFPMFAQRLAVSIPSRLRRLGFVLFHHPLPLQTETSFFILVNVLDIVFTNILLRMHAIEANPMANYVLIHWGFRGMIAFKLALVACVCLITQLIAVHHLRRARQTLYLGTVIVGLVVVYSAVLLASHQ